MHPDRNLFNSQWFNSIGGIKFQIYSTMTYLQYDWNRNQKLQNDILRIISTNRISYVKKSISNTKYPFDISNSPSNAPAAPLLGNRGSGRLNAIPLASFSHNVEVIWEVK